MRRLISQSAVQPLSIIEFEVLRQSFSGVPIYPVFPEVNLFIFHRSPQPLYKNVVVHPASAIHADSNPRCRQLPQKLRAGNLYPLVRIEDFWLREMIFPIPFWITFTPLESTSSLFLPAPPSVGTGAGRQGGRGQSPAPSNGVYFFFLGLFHAYPHQSLP